MRYPALLLLCGLLLALPKAPGAQDKPTVYVVAGSASSKRISRSKAKELADSAEDLRKQIGKRAHIDLAPTIESADILITILDRRIEFRQSRQTQYGGADTQRQYQSRHVIAYRVRVGELTRDGEYLNAGSLVTWRRVATGLSKEIERWARDNLELLLQQRAQR